ncbi:MAG: hypothetical protein K2N14_03740 [Clostridia bacterium]|nr:hypothetical protein [Clostridia bacterium]
MEELKPAKKQCRNCKYFIKYYYNKNGLFLPVSVGHCVGNKIHNRTYLRDFNSCEFWESDIPKTEQRNKSIEDALYKMADNLDQFIQIIKENNSQQ